MHTWSISLLSLVAGCALAAGSPPPALDLAVSPLAAARAEGPAGLARVLAVYDGMAPGRARDAFGLAIDAVAGQRYATVSRLYWYTDLPAAEAAAAARHVPILSLRMLGRLDEDLSCANSRLFRTTLYANAEVSQLLREHFVLHWSSERPVPRVTIDFGDGRTLERTTTGNSAHYVLDERGHVLDVLPGVYAPVAFARELRASLGLADRVRGLPAPAVAAAVAAYQQDLATHAVQRAIALQRAPIVDGVPRLLTRADVHTAALSLAQRVTVSKMIMEVPDLRRFGFAVESSSADDTAAWATAGEILYDLGGMPAILEPDLALAHAQPLPDAYGTPAAPHVLDAQSRALIERLHDAVPTGLGDLVATPGQLAALTDRLEQTLVADTALDQLRLRPQIARHIQATGGAQSFDELNAWIYAEVFHTPRRDAWLGLLPRTDFTGLPGDGIVLR